MIVHKAHKFRLYPTLEQEILLSKHFGSCRFVYNKFLHDKNLMYKENKKNLTYNESSKILTVLKKDENHSWLNEINSQSLQSTLKNLDNAYDSFFRKLTKFPRFKSKYDRQSFTIPQNIKIENDLLKIPKFRDGIKISKSIKFNFLKIIEATILKTPTGKYFVSINCEMEHISHEKVDSKIGIDTGIKHLAILSDGTKYENPKPLKTKIKKLKYQQRQLSKKQKDSNSRLKQKLKIARIHEKIVNCRIDNLHKVTTEIIKNHDIICVESLVVKNMMKNHSLAQSLSDVSLGTFYRFLDYKAKWNDRTIIKIDRFYPSSKSCSNCGFINQDMNLSIRNWTCPQCNTQHDRDINAANNILNQGLNILSGLGCKSDIKQKQIEALS